METEMFLTENVSRESSVSIDIVWIEVICHNPANVGEKFTVKRLYSIIKFFQILFKVHLGVSVV